MFKPGDTFEKYEVENLLKSGGMGEVYVVRHAHTKKRLALKRILPHLCSEKVLIERFFREAQVGARIEDCDHIVDVVDAGVDPEGSPYLVMEYLQGRDLGQILHTNRTLDPEILVEILRQTAVALDAAHKAGVIHRDIKPENIFIVEKPGKNPLVKVLDFGIAKIIESATQSGTMAGGTITYMAPEQGDRKAKIGPATDVWPLGLIAYRALVGRTFWNGDSSFAIMKELVSEPIPRASERARSTKGVELSNAFDMFFLRCLARDPEVRIASAGEAAEELARALEVKIHPERGALSSLVEIPNPGGGAEPPSAAGSAPTERASGDGPTPPARGSGTDLVGSGDAPVENPFVPKPQEKKAPAARASNRGAPKPAAALPQQSPQDLEAELKGAEARYAATRRKQLKLVLAIALIPALGIAGVLVGFWWDAKQTEKKLMSSWASFQMCTLGRVPDEQHPPNELRRKIELAKVIAERDKAKDGKASKPVNELKPCATYAQTILDSLDKGEAKNTEFIKQMGRFARPAEAATGRALGEQLDTLWAAGNNLKLVPGEADAAVPKPPTIEPAIELGGGTEVPITAGSVSVGRSRYAIAGTARRAWRIKDDFVVCDFSNAFKCKKFAGTGASNAPDAPPPLGDLLLLRTGSGSYEVSNGSVAKPIAGYRAFQSGTDAPRFSKEGTKAGTIDVFTWSPTTPAKELAVDAKDLTNAALKIFWDKMLLIGAETGGDIPADEIWPTIYDVQPNGTKKKIARVTNNANLMGQQACKAPNATYVYLRDEGDYVGGDAWVVTWIDNKPPSLRKVQFRTTDANPPTCTSEGLVLHYGLDRLTCPPEGECTNGADRIDKGCSDGKRSYDVEPVDGALLLTVAPEATPADAKTTLLLDLDGRGLKSSELVCGEGFAYAMLFMATSSRVLDLRTDPPSFK